MLPSPINLFLKLQGKLNHKSQSHGIKLSQIGLHVPKAFGVCVLTGKKQEEIKGKGM